MVHTTKAGCGKSRHEAGGVHGMKLAVRTQVNK